MNFKHVRENSVRAMRVEVCIKKNELRDHCNSYFYLPELLVKYQSNLEFFTLELKSWKGAPIGAISPAKFCVYAFV